MIKTLRTLYGLKWNPFSMDVPLEALVATPKMEDFAWRIENGIAPEGGFSLVVGEPGFGKSVVLRLLAERLAGLREVTVGAVQHPQSNIADFYREMGELFGEPAPAQSVGWIPRAARSVGLAHREHAHAPRAFG